MKVSKLVCELFVIRLLLLINIILVFWAPKKIGHIICAM